MDNVYLIDYLNMIYLRAGFFETRAAAEKWIAEHGQGQHGWSIVTLDKAREDGVPSTRTYLRYICQR